jgi:hypothetical protein
MPDVSYFRVFSCKAYVFIEKEQQVKSNKIAPCTEMGILVGYKSHNIWRVYFPGRYGTKVVCSSYVRFDEGGIVTEPFPAGSSMPKTRSEGETVQDFYNHDKETNKPVQPISEISFNKDQQPQPQLLQLQLSPPLKATIEEIEDEYFSDGQSINNNTTLSKIEVEPLDLPEINVPESKPKKGRPKGTKNKQHFPPKPSEKRLTRAKAKRARQFAQETYFISHNSEESVLEYLMVFHAGIEVKKDPKIIEKALSGLDAKKWRLAILSEYKSLSRQKTWTLVKRGIIPLGVKVLLGKLVFKTKNNKDSDFLKAKIRWVVKGFY